MKNGYKLGVRITKPLLMPILIFIYLNSAKDINYFVVLALIFGFFGDVFLMLNSKLFFIGAVSFLVGHLFYIAAFLQGIHYKSNSFAIFILAMPYVFYGLYLYKELFAYIKNMKIVAIAYIFIELFMSFSCLQRVFVMENFSFVVSLIGSILFIISDTILAYNNFKAKIKDAGLYIMLTYIIGQFLIVLGFVISID